MATTTGVARAIRGAICEASCKFIAPPADGIDRNTKQFADSGDAAITTARSFQGSKPALLLFIKSMKEHQKLVPKFWIEWFWISLIFRLVLWHLLLLT